jgi:isopentenyl phosphate kinase
MPTFCDKVSGLHAVIETHRKCRETVDSEILKELVADGLIFGISSARLEKVLLYRPTTKGVATDRLNFPPPPEASELEQISDRNILAAAREEGILHVTGGIRRRLKNLGYVECRKRWGKKAIWVWTEKAQKIFDEERQKGGR